MKYTVRIPIQLRPVGGYTWGQDRIDFEVEAQDMTELQCKLDTLGKRLSEVLKDVTFHATEPT